MKINSGEWVVVFDGGKALILANAGDEMFPNLQVKETHEHASPRTSEQGTDKPGRVHESAGVGRSSVAQTDWHERDEREFITALAERLDQAVDRGETPSLIIVAAPRALGILREVHSHVLRDAIKTEIAKDYVNKPVFEIEKLLTAAAL